MTRDTDDRPGTTDATAADAAADAATGAPDAATDATETADAAATPGLTEDESDANGMGDVDHTHPHGNTTFGSIFGRGPTVAADGGAPAVVQDDTSMREVSHESPTGTDPNAAFERGGDVADGRRGVRTDE